VRGDYLVAGLTLYLIIRYWRGAVIVDEARIGRMVDSAMGVRR
jgi:hypothetical protein